MVRILNNTCIPSSQQILFIVRFTFSLIDSFPFLFHCPSLPLPFFRSTARRASWRALNVDENKNNPAVVRFRQVVEAELETLCKDVLELLEKTLIPHAEATEEAKVFYQKMAGDYFRYLAEFISNDELPELQRKSADYYKAAMETASTIMEPTDPVRLGLALNYSVCLYEIIKDRQAACQLAKNAFDQAILRLDRLDEQQYKDGTLILQLLRDNLTLWTSSPDDNEAEPQDTDD